MNNIISYNNAREEALENDPVNFRFFASNPSMLKNTAAAAFPILDEKRNGVYSDQVHHRNLLNLRSLITAGQEPIFDLGPIWAKTLVAIMVTIAKETPSLWNEFSASEKLKFDLVMRMFAITSSIGTDAKNHYKTNLKLNHPYSKRWNLNIRLANFPPIVFAAKYFNDKETDAFDTVLNNGKFDYDALLAELRAAGFNRAADLLETPGFELPNGEMSNSIRDIIQNGGDLYYKDNSFGFENIIYGGWGVGIRTVYHFVHDTKILSNIIDITMPMAILGELAKSAYWGPKSGFCIQQPRIVVNDNTYGLAEGLDSNEEYMYYELNSADGLGQRTSLWHATIDFILLTFIIDAAELLNLTEYQGNASNKTIDMNMMRIINRDLMYKINNSYIGFSLGREEYVTINTVKKIGYDYAATIWNEFYSNEEN